MNSRSSKAFVLVGPTASGKSSVVQFLAERTGQVIVSADSMNIYRGMDIGTAKPSVAQRAAVSCYGIDLADPTESFSVGDWLQAVKPAFENQPPLVAGGTGLYVKCLLQGLADLPAADEALRERAQQMRLDELQALAQKTAPAAYAALADPENPRRLVRLLETSAHRATGSPSAWQREMPTVIGLHVERDVLCRRIVARVDAMYANGLLDEARALRAHPLSVTAQKAIGYAEAFAVLSNEMTEAQAKERTVIRTRQLAKRQGTWFRTQLKVQWIANADYSSVEALADRVAEVWRKNGPVPLSLNVK